MAITFLAVALGAVFQEEPAQTPQDSYSPVAYERPEGLPESRAASPQEPQRVRPSRYVDRGQLGIKDSEGPTRKRGFRIEARTGWDRITLGAEGDDDRSDGLLHGVGIGYDRSFDRWFLGVFAGIDGSTATTTGLVASAPNELTGAVTETQFETDASYSIEYGVRTGWWLREGWNVYADASWARLTVDVETETTVVTPVIGAGPNGEDILVRSASFVMSESVSANGYRVGIGTEANLTDDLYATARGRLTYYDEDDAGAETEQFEILTGVGVRF